MKVIDLLNKIANGEEVPKKIRFDCAYWNRVCNGKYTYYTNEDNDNDLFLYFFRNNLTFTLNDEVEIIEEDKKINKLDLKKAYPECEDTRFEEVQDKINEIIDYLQSKGDE